MGSEFVQFGVMGLVFLLVGVLWLAVIYLPGRTMERWEGEAEAEEVRADESREQDPGSPRVRNGVPARDPLTRS